MPANKPYDPRYNAKLYVPKLTEAQRLARATPLENLRSLRFRTGTPAAPTPAEAVIPKPAATAAQRQPKTEAPTPQIEPTAPSTGEAPAPVPVPTRSTTEPGHVPSACEVVFAEFPELYPERCGQGHGSAHRHELCLMGVARPDGDPACGSPGTSQTLMPPPYPSPRSAREGDSERHSPLPLMQSFRFGSKPGAPPHSPPASKLHR